MTYIEKTNNCYSTVAVELHFMSTPHSNVDVNSRFLFPQLFNSLYYSSSDRHCACSDSFLFDILSSKINKYYA